MTIKEFGSPEAKFGSVRCLECAEEDKQERYRDFQRAELDAVLDGGVNVESIMRRLGDKVQKFYETAPGEHLIACGSEATTISLWAAEHDHVKPDHHILVYYEDKSHPLSDHDIVELGWFGGR